ncbi:hypothetical protein GCM10010178_70070 [Lentzea flava]|uniref:Uncharacterized protein n=1 Tax=Lentzea flava TaxID=103732 RepID=A0ABQ2V4Z6_9PSEU|nr:hypothetical protein GCM10010178_70070 [Lentzea flava]
MLRPGDWAAFVAERRAKCVEQQRKRGLGERWLEHVPGFLYGVHLLRQNRG